MALLCLLFVPYPSKLHNGVCKPVWPSGCEGGGQCFLKQCCSSIYGFVRSALLFLPQASSPELVDQCGHLVVRGKAIVVFKTLLLCFFVPYPSKLHVGVSKPVWPSGCQGGGHCFFKQCCFLIHGFVRSAFCSLPKQAIFWSL